MEGAVLAMVMRMTTARVRTTCRVVRRDEDMDRNNGSSGEREGN